MSASPTSFGLVNAAARRAQQLEAAWFAVHADRGSKLTPREDRERVARHLRLAQTLGAEASTVPGQNPVQEILSFAQRRHVTRILVGRPTHARWRDLLARPFLDELVRASPLEIEIMAEGEPLVVEPAFISHRAPPPLRAWVEAVLVPASASMLSIILGRAELADIVMVYLAGVVLVAMRRALLPALLAAGLSVLAFDYFFVPPLHALGFADPRHAVTVVVMFTVAAIISVLSRRTRAQAEAARRREARTATLYALTRALAAAKTEREVVQASTAHVSDSFGARAEIDLERIDAAPRSGELCVPIQASTGPIGALVLRRGPTADSNEEREMLAAFAAPIAAAIDRARLAEIARAARLRVETEQMRNALLSSVSHDLRTPLAVITGAATTLLDGKVDAETSRELTEEIVLEAERLHRIVRNLLDMTRLEAHALEVKKEWQPLEEIVGAALDRLNRVLEGRLLRVALDEELPLVPFDPILVEQVLVNLVENAARHTPKDREITILAKRRDHEVEVVVADRGTGVPAGDEERIFERFQTASKAGGTGLGLTICRGIVQLHGGRIWAKNAEGGGAELHFTLPLEGEPPRVDASEDEDEPSAPEEARA